MSICLILSTKRESNMKSLHRLSFALLVAGVISAPANADQLSQASAQSSGAASLLTASVVVGSVAALEDGSRFTVQSVEKVGDGVVYVLKEVSTGVSIAVKASGTAVGEVSV